MVKQYGDDHPITEQALILTMHYTPRHIEEEMHQKAKELNLIATAKRLFGRRRTYVPPRGYCQALWH